AEAERTFRTLLALHPDNLAVLLEVARLAAKTGDSTTLQTSVGKLAKASAAWPAPAKEQMDLLAQAASGSNPRSAAVRIVYLRNTLVRVPEYRQSLNEVKTPSTFIDDPFDRFLRLPIIPSAPAAPDFTLQFRSRPIEGAPATARWTGAVA